MEYDIAKEYCKIIQQKLNMNEFDDALANARKLVTYDANYAEGYYYLGLCHFALGNFDESVQDYETCLKLDPEFAKAYYNLGITKYYLNRFKEAVTNMETAYKIFSKQENKNASNKCAESIEFIKEEQGL